MTVLETVPIVLASWMAAAVACGLSLGRIMGRLRLDEDLEARRAARPRNGWPGPRLSHSTRR